MVLTDVYYEIYRTETDLRRSFPYDCAQCYQKCIILMSLEVGDITPHDTENQQSLVSKGR